MARSTRYRSSIAVALAALVGTLGVVPGVAGAHADVRTAAAATSATSGQDIDLGVALDVDGVFQGAVGMSGSVDIAGWTLASDLARGEAPRFVRARTRPQSAAVGAWAAVGPNGTTPSMNEEVDALAPTRNKLYIGGVFYNAGGTPKPNDADNLAKWSGSAWSAVGSTNDVFGPNAVKAIAVDGSDLYLGGSFINAAGIGAADKIVMWDDSASSWEALDSGLNGEVRAIAISGSNVYAGGDFTEAGLVAAADYIARWDGSNWNALGSRAGDGVLGGHVNAIALNGGTVYAGGLFTEGDGDQTMDYVATWDGTNWSALGSIPAGTRGALSAEVHALRFSGRSLYAGGDFEDADGIPEADRVARWRGGSWSALGSDGSGDGALGSTVYAIAVAGEDVYVGGQFSNAAGIDEADRIALWDGSDWSALGDNGAGNGALNNTGQALAVFKRDLYVGGQFTSAAGIGEADYLASWGLRLVKLPDGRVRVGTSGSYIGNDIYNASADHQSVTKGKQQGQTITYQLSIQNDSPTSNDRFFVEANAGTATHFQIKYFYGTTNVTTAVENGTYRTTALTPGDTFVIKVAVKVKNSASNTAKVTRKLTITSANDSTRVDAAKVVAEAN